MRELVQDGLTYLNKRTDFWRQQKPLYARRKDTRQREKKKYATRDQAAVKKLSKFMKKLEEIDAGMDKLFVEFCKTRLCMEYYDWLRFCMSFGEIVKQARIQIAFKS